MFVWLAQVRSLRFWPQFRYPTTDCSFLLIVAVLFGRATDGASRNSAEDVKATPLRMWSGSVADVGITSLADICTAGANGGGVYLDGQAGSL